MKRDDVLDFFTQLDRLPKGDRTALKREAGTMLHEADGRAIQAFYKCMLPTTPERYDDRFFAAACLHCLWSEDTQNRLPMEQIFYQLGKDTQISASTEHRLVGILDLTWGEDGFLLGKLARLIKLAKSKNYAVDCAALLIDLIYWNGLKQTVQLRWARSLYMRQERENANTKEGE